MGVGVSNRKLFLCMLALSMAAISYLLFTDPPPAHAAAGISQQMNFQGRLLTIQGATVPDGFYNVQFKIYQDGDGQSVGDTTGSPSGSLKWTETYLNNNSQGVVVKNGFMSVQLGSVNPFGSSVDWNQDTLWLSMNIAGVNATCTPFSSCSPDGEMVPMKRLSTSPYALNAGQLGGLASSQFVQLAQGLQTDASNSASIQINKTGTGNIMTLQSGGNDALLVTNAGDVTFGANSDHLLSVATAGAGVAGKLLTIVAGSAGTGSTLAGGNLVLQGGAGSGGGASGSVIVKANTTNSAGTFKVTDASNNSLLNISASNKTIIAGSGLTLPVPNLRTPTSATTGGSIANGTTYYYGITALNGATETEISPIVTITIASATATNTVTLNWPASYSATGYKIYRNTTNSFTSGSLLLTTIGSGATITYTDTGSATSTGLPPSTTYAPTLFKVDAAANNPFASGQTTLLGSMYYNTTSGEFQCYKDAGVGGSWTDCGVTDLQGAYNNITNAGTSPTIKLDSDRGTLNIQDANTTIGADLLDVRTSNSSGLGAVLFSIGNTGTVSIQNATDQNSVFRTLDQSGRYLLNVNTASGYFITNTIAPLSNTILNPGFETGGNITSGEEGWNGPNLASIVNSSANAHAGNYELQVSANTSTLKTYAGSYYGVSPNDVVYFESWVKNSAGANGTGGVIIEGYDKDKALIGSATDSGTLPGTSYIFKSAKYTVPSNVAYIRVAAVVNSGATTGTYYFDDFQLLGSQRGQQLFQNTSDSTTAFQIQSASATQTLFTADTSSNLLKVGDATGTDTATTILVLDSATANPTTSLASRNGGLFYRSDTGSLKAIIGGAVVDVCTTAVTCSGYSASASATIQLQGTSPGTQQIGNFNISGVGILTQLQTQDQSASSTNSSNLVIRTGNATGTTSNSGNLTLDVGTATGTLGSITIGHSGVATTMAGTLDIQAASALKLGTSSSADGSILFRNSAGGNTVTLKAAGANPSSSYSITLPQNLGSSGDCLKDSGSGALAFSNCAAGITVTLQDTYNNSSPATITTANSKDLNFVSQDTTVDSNILFNLQCTTCSANGGRFAVQNGGTDVLTVKPNGGGIILAGNTQIGSDTTDSTQVNFQLDSYNQNTDSGTCSATVNQGVMYYNTAMGSIRSCINGSWNDLSNPDTLGLMSFGIVPSTGSNPYDLPAATTAGVTGPCKVSWASATSLSIQACVAYSGGRRVNVTANTLTTNSATTNNVSLTTTNIWGHICLTGANSQPAFTSTAGTATESANQPTFSITAPILCLADVKGSTSSAGTIDDLYDVRTFTSTLKEAVISSSIVSLGMLVDSNGTNGAMIPAASSSQKLYGLVVATNGSTSSGAPNVIVNTVGPGWVKAVSGTAGDFVKTNGAGYATTTATIPNNSFYFSAGNTRTAFNTTCTSASTCTGSLYVNFIVR